MLAARDNKHNIVEKLLELGAVTTDRDKASESQGGELISYCNFFYLDPIFNYTS